MIELSYRYICDRCGEQIGKVDVYKFNRSRMPMPHPSLVHEAFGMQLCPDCFNYMNPIVYKGMHPDA